MMQQTKRKGRPPGAKNKPKKPVNNSIPAPPQRQKAIPGNLFTATNRSEYHERLYSLFKHLDDAAAKCLCERINCIADYTLPNLQAWLDNGQINLETAQIMAFTMTGAKDAVNKQTSL